MTARGTRKSRRVRTKRALVTGTLPAVVAATTVTGAAAQAAPTGQPQPTEPVHPAHCVKRVVEITWRDPSDNRYLQIKNASKANGALVNTAKRVKGSKNQEWNAHLTCEFSAFGADLWSFQNVHSGLCLAVGPRPHNHVRNDAAQHPCGRHFTRWTYTESRISTFVNGHRKFRGWMLDLLSPNAVNNTGQVICDDPKAVPFFDSFNDAAAGGGCLWR